MKTKFDIKDDDLKIEDVKDEDGIYDLTFKLIVIGDSGVGKTCLINKAVKDDYNSHEEYQPTVGFEFLSYSLKINDQIIKLQIWDTCGQEIYRSLISNFYRNASMAILVYSINSKESFDSIKSWIEELKLRASNDIRILLIGNKCDIEKREVSEEDAHKLFNELNFDMFFETSAKMGTNTKTLLGESAKILYRDYTRNKMESKELSESSYEITGNDTTIKAFTGNMDEQKYKKLGKVQREQKCCF